MNTIFFTFLNINDWSDLHSEKQFSSKVSWSVLISIFVSFGIFWKQNWPKLTLLDFKIDILLILLHLSNEFDPIFNSSTVGKDNNESEKQFSKQDSSIVICSLENSIDERFLQPEKQYWPNSIFDNVLLDNSLSDSHSENTRFEIYKYIYLYSRHIFYYFQ